MADEADIAQTAVDLELAHALASRELPPAGNGSTECDDCGNPIPSGRTALGYRICVECAGVTERRR